MAGSICLCGSMAFIDEMEEIADRLATMGYRASAPAREERELKWSHLPAAEAVILKKSFVDGYLAKIRQADALLIANYQKHGIAGYVGPNTLMEAAFGYTMGIPIIFLHDPSNQSCGLECLAIASGCLNGEIPDINHHLR